MIDPQNALQTFHFALQTIQNALRTFQFAL